MTSLHGIDGPQPDPGEPAAHRELTQLERRALRAGVLAVGTLACPDCDAPVVPAEPLSPASPLSCPYCGQAGAVRDFLSLAPPTRPARVVVRVVDRSARAALR